MPQKKQFLHFDTINSTYKTDSYNASFKLAIPLQRVSRLYLKSIELPIGFCNVRNNYSTVSYNITQNGTTFTKTFKLLEKTYNSISLFLFDLNAAFLTSITPFLSINEGPPVFYVNPLNTNKIIMVQTLINTVMTLNGIGFLPFYFLGYNNDIGIKVLNVTTTYFSNVYNLNFDNYLNMTFINLPLNTTTNSLIACSFKIPLNSTQNIVYFNSENSSFTQDINFNDINYITNKLDVVICDRYGINIASNGLDYSFSLGIEFI